MYVKYAFVADHVTPAGSGKWNVLGTFTTMQTKSFPYKHPRLGLLIRVEGHSTETGKHVLEIHLIDEDGQRLRKPKAIKMEFEFGSSKKGFEGVPLGMEVGVEINNLEFENPGNYEFAIKVDGTYLDSAPLYVRKQSGRG